jgi:hypothetical protein
MNLRHYYHIYAVEGWEDVVEEHLTALTESGLMDALDHDGFRVGIVASTREEQERVYDFCSERVSSVNVVRYCYSGWEQATLSMIRVWEHIQNREGAILYAHTKGVHDPSEINVAWRRSMEAVVVQGWRECLRRLEPVDAVGCHWLSKEEWPDNVDTPFFGGNWWWAKATYVRRLDEPSYENRWFGETWLGSKNPLVDDLLPGWPDLSLFRS